MTLAAGTKLGPYEILSPLGAGGMGEVYRARDSKLNRDVAIKVLPERFASDADSLSRFEREARAVAALSHPNILAIHDFGTHDGVPYAVMELLEGETLREALSGGALPVRRATELAREIARGLAAAHEKGIVHRDLKPDNIFLTRDGRVKILDFGLAKTTGTVPAEGETRSPTVSAYTEPGTVMGTVGYMSPEQVRGHGLDHRSDIFSFGTVLCEMLTGRAPFQRETVAETMTAILKEEPSGLAGVPAGLERIARHCLEKKADQRFQSASDIAFALDSPSSVSGDVAMASEARASSPKRSRAVDRLVFAALGGAAAVLLAHFLLAALHRGSAAAPLPAMRFTIVPPKDMSFQGMLALSPDGKRLAFVAARAFGQDVLFMRALDSLEARPLDGTEGASFPFWSPDGRSIAFFAQGKLKKIDPAGGAPQTLCDAASARGGTWGTKGTILFSANAGAEIERVAETGGKPIALGQIVQHGAEWFRWPAFLPDGRNFLYFDLSGDPGVRGIYVASLDAKQVSRLAPSDAGAVYAAGGLLFRVGDRLMWQPFDAERLRVTGEASPVVEDVWWDALSTLVTAFTVSGNGVLAYQTGGLTSTQLLWLDRSGRELGVVGPPGAYIEPALSPDGKWIAMTRAEPESGRLGVWTMDVERGNLAPFSSVDGFAAGPLWTPDGQSIAFSIYPSGGVHIKDAHGEGSEKVLFEPRSFGALEDFSRDGRFLVYDTIDFKTFHLNIEVRDLQSGQDRRVNDATWDESGARLSPDGRWLAYASNESGKLEIFVRSFPASGYRRQVSTGGGTQPVWRGDGKELFYVAPDGKVMAADIRAEPGFEAGVPRALFQTRILPLVEARNNYDVTRDGQRFLVNSRRPEDAALPITVIAPWVPGAKP